MPVIYWIRYPEHKDPLTEGYVGITDNLEYRIKYHKKQAVKEIKSPKDEALLGPRSHELLIETIFEGSSLECANEEKRLRPTKHIGWNVATGGGYNRRTEQQKLYRRMKQGWISKRQYDLLINDLNNAY